MGSLYKLLSAAPRQGVDNIQEVSIHCYIHSPLHLFLLQPKIQLLTHSVTPSSLCITDEMLRNRFQAEADIHNLSQNTKLFLCLLFNRI